MFASSIESKTVPLEKGKSASITSLESGRLYEGVVIDTSADTKSVTVALHNSALQVPGCRVGASILSALLGFKTSFLPAPNTNVILMYSTSPVVLCSLPSDKPDGPNAETHSTTGGDLAVGDLTTFQADQDSRDHSAHTFPNDMLEGEFEIANTLGVALTMLTTLSKLSAGARAQVSVHLLNDMVRILSKTFRHFSSFGDMQIYNDGRLNVRWDGTSYEHEALGRLNARDPKVDIVGGMVDFSSIDKVVETGRWRFSQFLGFMGNFIHLFVTDPVTTLGSLATEAFTPIARSGNANLHVGSAGEILFQTVSEIALERVVRVVVPIEMKRNDDPTGTLAANYDSLQASFLKIWDYGQNNQTIAHTAYQLREYARWLSTYHSLARFHQTQASGGDWTVPVETDIPTPDWTSRETDKAQANPNATLYKDCYATIRIMRDGSIVAMEAGGSALSMVQGCFQIAAPKHGYIEAAGNLYLRSGQNIYMTARRSIELAAIAGGLTLKARAFWKALCEWGSVYIKSDAPDPNAADYTALTQEDCTWGDQDPLPEVLEQAVLIEATAGQTQVMGKTKAVICSDGTPVDDDDTGNVEMRSRFNHTRVAARNDVQVYADRDFRVKTAGNFLLVAAKALWDIRAQMFDINQRFNVSGGIVNCQNIRTRIISALSSFVGPPRPRPGANGTSHENHIDTLPSDTDSYAPVYAGDDDPGITALGDLADDDYLVPAEFTSQRPVWDFQPSADTTVSDDDTLFQSLAQQRIVTDTSLSDDYEAWTWSGQNLLQNQGTNGPNLPALAATTQQWEHHQGTDLFTPSSQTAGEIAAAQNPLVKAQVIVQFLKT
jgi:hypothetical protein